MESFLKKVDLMLCASSQGILFGAHRLIFGGLGSGDELASRDRFSLPSERKNRMMLLFSHINVKMFQDRGVSRVSWGKYFFLMFIKSEIQYCLSTI